MSKPEYKPEEVIAELGDIDRYRLRKLKTKTGAIYDLREYVESDTFTGFTKKGVRLTIENIQQLWRKAAKSEGIDPTFA